MKALLTNKAIPSGISEYIRKNFHAECLTEINKVNQKGGHFIYVVEVSHDDNLYHLRFNDKGVLMSNKAEPAFELSSEDDFYDEEETSEGKY